MVFPSFYTLRHLQIYKGLMRIGFEDREIFYQAVLCDSTRWQKEWFDFLQIPLKYTISPFRKMGEFHLYSKEWWQVVRGRAFMTRWPLIYKLLLSLLKLGKPDILLFSSSLWDNIQPCAYIISFFSSVSYCFSILYGLISL